MRPHVEIVDERDLIWHPAEFEHATGHAKQQNLSYDEENGAASLKVEFSSEWQRPAGLHNAQTEWFVLKGEVTVGNKTLSEGGYWCAPKGVLTPAISVTPGTEILLFRDYGNWGFELAEQDSNEKNKGDKFITQDSRSMDWYEVEDPENGSPMDFERGGTPVPGLYIKLLHRDPATGFYTRLIKAKPGWVEHPLAHHPVFEEFYCLEGDFDYNFGVMTEGQYSFRPAGVRHGDFIAGKDKGCTWLVRCDGDLVDWYTEEAYVEMKGKPVNWGEGFPNTEPPVLVQPVRSRSAGVWKDPTYQ
ncbi:MAG: quercetin dioxygenase-like cupin family protein [Oceanicoccus sp.]|jgi:quercetin dioxygenase-like cupin family protein